MNKILCVLCIKKTTNIALISPFTEKPEVKNANLYRAHCYSVGKSSKHQKQFSILFLAFSLEVFFSLLFLLLSTRWKTKTIKMLSGLHFNVISFYLMCVKRFFLLFSFWMFQISLRTSTHLLVCMYVCVCAAR